MKAIPGPRQADDFTWYWLAARALLDGQNPYSVIHIGGRYALDTPFVYPLTTAIAIIPFAAWLDPVSAAPFFIGVSSPNCTPTGTKSNRREATIMGGPVLLLALLRWRRPEARLLLALAIVPQSILFYDQLLLWLVPATMRQSVLLSLLSVLALILGERGFPAGAGHAEVTAAYAPMIMALLFLPCLIMVLRRPNVSDEPPPEPLPAQG